MTLGENKKMTLAVIEEYSQTNQYLTDDEDIRNRINLVYWPNYQHLSEKNSPEKYPPQICKYCHIS